MIEAHSPDKENLNNIQKSDAPRKEIPKPPIGLGHWKSCCLYQDRQNIEFATINTAPKPCTLQSHEAATWAHGF